MGTDRGRSSVQSPLKKVIANCSSAMKDYGKCIVRITPNLEKGLCEKEFQALQACMRTVLKKAR